MQTGLRQCLVCLGVALGVFVTRAQADGVPLTPTAFLDLPNYSILKTALALDPTAFATFATRTNATFFAPNNTAFQALGTRQLTCLTLQPGAGRSLLSALLLYHSLKGYTPAASAPTFGTPEESFLPNSYLTIQRDAASKALTVNGVAVTAPDLALVLPPVGVAVHGVPAVLVPPGGGEALLAETCQPLVPLLRANSSYSFLASQIFNGTLTVALTKLLNGTGATIFAPQDAAFKALGNQTIECLVNTTNGRALLATILGYHVVAGACDADCMVVTRNLTSISSSLSLSVDTNIAVIPTVTTVAGVTVTDFDLFETYEGTVHAVSGLLLPPNAAQMLQQTCGTKLVASPPPPSTPPPPPPATTSSPPPTSTTSQSPSIYKRSPPPPAPASGSLAGFAAPATGLSILVAALSLVAATLA